MEEKYKNVTSFAHSMSGMSFNGCGTPLDGTKYDFHFCTGYQILNTDLSSYDVIIVVGNCSDYKNATLMEMGNENDESLYSIHGAWNLILKEFNKKYKDKKIIFFTPLYHIDKKPI